MWQVQQIALFFMPLALGYAIGRWRESHHLRSLARREVEYGDITVTNLKAVTHPEQVRQVLLVTGEAVIATDYFKSFAAALRNLIGGEMRAYETLMDRARREATLRMVEEARRAGAREVWNFRLGTSNIRSSGGRRRQAPSVEVFAFGTAVVRE